MFSGSEFLITYSPQKVHIQTIGYKLVMLSKKVIQKYDWLFIKNSSVVPFYDGCGSCKGSQLIFQLDDECFPTIDLKDQDLNNIYKYKSDVVLCGKKKFYLAHSENNKEKILEDEYIIVSSVVLRKDFIEMDIFDPNESHYVLRKAQLLQLGMRTPDLKFITLNNFDSIQQIDMFRT